MRKLIERLWQNESGVTSVEYALLAAAAAAIVGVAGTAFYTKLQTAFDAINLSTDDASGSGGSG
ncbi:MAG: Flp family type IVb pilin [Sneathiella sp.]